MPHLSLGRKNCFQDILLVKSKNFFLETRSFAPSIPTVLWPSIDAVIPFQTLVTSTLPMLSGFKPVKMNTMIWNKSIPDQEPLVD